MMTQIDAQPAALAVVESAPLAHLADVAAQARRYVEEATAPNTRRAYRTDWQDFVAWCTAHQHIALPATPETVVLYLTDRSAVMKVATLRRRLVSITKAHQAAQLDPPTRSLIVHEVMHGIARHKAAVGEQVNQKTAAVTETIRLMVRTRDNTPIGIRDRALLLVGFAGAFRRSELVHIDREDVRITREGLTIYLMRSKTDQEGQGQLVGIPYGHYEETCPVRALQHWLKASGITSGPIFRPITRHGVIQPTRLSPKAVASIVKRTATAAGLDPAEYAGHSLRAGLATAAGAAGVEERHIMRQTRHKSVEVARRYIRHGSVFRDNAAGKVGL